jgi:ABC-type sugar transport system permease subunit
VERGWGRLRAPLLCLSVEHSGSARHRSARRISDCLFGLDQPAQIQPEAAAHLRFRWPVELSEEFWSALWITLAFTAFAVALVVALGLAIPPVVNGLMWQWIYDSKVGALNGLLFSLGLISSHGRWCGLRSGPGPGSGAKPN